MDKDTLVKIWMEIRGEPMRGNIRFLVIFTSAIHCLLSNYLVIFTSAIHCLLSNYLV